jgi:hypothetical protein
MWNRRNQLKDRQIHHKTQILIRILKPLLLKAHKTQIGRPSKQTTKISEQVWDSSQAKQNNKRGSSRQLRTNWLQRTKSTLGLFVSGKNRKRKKPMRGPTFSIAATMHRQSDAWSCGRFEDSSTACNSNDKKGNPYKRRTIGQRRRAELIGRSCTSSKP